MSMFKKILLVVTLLLPIIYGGEVKGDNPPYKTPTGMIDAFFVDLYNKDNKWVDRIIVRTDNTVSVDVYDAKNGDAIDMGATYEDLLTRKNTILGGKLIPTLLSKIAMPYGDNYFIDIPLVMQKMKKGETYYFKLGFTEIEKAVKVVEITDLNTGIRSGNLYADDAVFTFTSPMDKTDYEFALRLYGAEPFKETSASGEAANRWNDPENWLSGKLPGENSHVIIPEGTETLIKDGENLKVGYLTNLGVLINNGTLEVSDFMEVSSK